MLALKRFLRLHALWALAITLLIVPLSISVGGLNLSQYLRWFGHAIALAAFPAGLMVGAAVFQGRDVWRKLGLVTLAQVGLMLVVLVLLGFIAPPSDEPNVLQLLLTMSDLPTDSWLRWNRHAWLLFMTIAEVVSVPIYAGLGLMLGAWAEQVLPLAFRRILFWAMTLKLVAFTFLLTENLYELVIIRTNGPAAGLAFVMLLIPLGMYGGLLLPSISLARRAEVA